MAQTIFITGSSTGIGRATAKLFHQNGWNVVATMRSPEKEEELKALDNVLVTQLDVLDQASIDAAVKVAVDQFGQIDVLLNNAGYGIMGPMETLDDALIRRQFDVNYFGVIDCMKAVLPHMRQRKKGMIINVSSIGGLVAYPYLTIYNSTKFALECLTEGAQYELNPLGIKLKLIEPGAIKTQFGGSMQLSETGAIEDYKPGFGTMVSKLEGMLDNASSPELVADVIWQAATDGTDQVRYLAGQDAVDNWATRRQMEDAAFKNMFVEQLGL